MWFDVYFFIINSCICSIISQLARTVTVFSKLIKRSNFNDEGKMCHLKIVNLQLSNGKKAIASWFQINLDRLQLTRQKN
ncbi:hypothetical protein CQA23_13520 [Enterococcus faecalis]|nr:hypothetical protein CQA23_13520 [Enterococcus faecalis]